MYSIDFDRSSGVLQATCRGMWSVAEAQRYCVELERWTQMARESCGAVRLVLDCCDYGFQTPEVLEALVPAREAVMQTEADRLAVFMDPGLTRMQVRRMVTSEQTKVFANEAEARAWVLAAPRL